MKSLLALILSYSMLVRLAYYTCNVPHGPDIKYGKSATHSNGTLDHICTIVSLVLSSIATLAIYQKQMPQILTRCYCEETRMPLQ